MDRLELQKLRDLPIEGVAERLGLQVVRHKALCPFHDDHHASLSFSVRRNTYRCFVCGASGGPIDLVMKYLGKPFLEACSWLADEHSIIIENLKLNIESVKRQNFNFQSSIFNIKKYERLFEHPFLNDEAKKFLFEERRLDPRVVRWCRLTSWRDKQGVPWLQIPYYNREGKLIGIQNRNLTPSQPPQGEENRHSPLGEKEGGTSPWGGQEGVKPTAGIKKRFAEILHHEVDRSARGPADEAAVAVPAHRERQRGMVVVVERTQGFVPHNLESKSLRDALNGQVAKLLQF